MKTIVGLTTCLLVSGCGGLPMNPYADPEIITGNSRSVRVKGASFPDTLAKAQQLADKHCGQYSRVALFRSDGGYQIIYDCVDP